MLTVVSGSVLWSTNVLSIGLRGPLTRAPVRVQGLGCGLVCDPAGQGVLYGPAHEDACGKVVHISSNAISGFFMQDLGEQQCDAALCYIHVHCIKLLCFNN